MTREEFCLLKPGDLVDVMTSGHLFYCRRATVLKVEDTRAFLMHPNEQLVMDRNYRLIKRSKLP